MEDRGIVLKQTLLFFYAPTLLFSSGLRFFGSSREIVGRSSPLPQYSDIRAMRRANLLTCAE